MLAAMLASPERAAVPARKRVLGLSSFYHDSAACLVEDGEIVVALQEERESRLKHDADFPVHASRACLADAGITSDDLDLVVFYEIPSLHVERVLESQLRFAPRGIRAFPRAIRSLFGGKMWVERAIAEGLSYEGRVLFVPHHLAHAASAFLPSPFEEAAVVTIDAVGEWATTTIGVGRGAEVELLEEQRFPHSLGMFYAAMTAWAGLKVNSGEYKLMGLSPYGQPRFVEALQKEVVFVGDDGTIRLNLRHFDFPAGLSIGRESLGAFLGGPPRPAGAPLGQREADIAASAQVIVEDAMRRIVLHAREVTGQGRICMAGGVALNCVAVGKLLDEGVVADVFVQPAAGDAGGALGAALLGAQELEPGSRPTRAPGGDAMRGALLGPRIDDAGIQSTLDGLGLVYERLEDEQIDERTAAALADGKIVGWFQGRMEFGPRALGARSILADARGEGVRARVNREMKRRESFRPFAPAVLEAEADAWFVVARPSPYMTRTLAVRNFDGAELGAFGDFDAVRVRAPLPAVTHVDGSARIQTVNRRENPRFWALLSAFHQRTGVPVLLNTSFNLRGEPIVSRPLDAVRTFAHSGLEVLVVGNFFVRRDAQPSAVLQRIDAPRLVED
jgi:carbamoyltransferase